MGTDNTSRCVHVVEMKKTKLGDWYCAYTRYQLWTVLEHLVHRTPGRDEIVTSLLLFTDRVVRVSVRCVDCLCLQCQCCHTLLLKACCILSAK